MAAGAQGANETPANRDGAMRHPSFWRQLEEERVFTNEPDLPLVAALYDFGYFDAEDIARFADGLLSAGVIDDELIAVDTVAPGPETRALFERWLAAQGLPRTTREQAALALARVVCHGMLAGEVSAFEGGKIIWQDIYNECRSLEQLFPFVSDASAYEDCLAMVQRDERAYLEALMDHARELARVPGAGETH